jgi:hypothetical protein
MTASEWKHIRLPSWIAGAPVHLTRNTLASTLDKKAVGFRNLIFFCPECPGWPGLE